MRILLVEDEPEMARLVSSLVSNAGFGVDHVDTLSEATEVVRQIPYDLVLLDRRLPDGDGMTLVSTVRRSNPGIRVLMLTARDAIEDLVTGLDYGADDYLTKPFRGPELIARIRACLRRPGGDVQPPIAIGALTFDPQTRDVCVHGQPIALHKQELALLEALARRLNRVTTRGALIGEIYGVAETVHANALEALVSRLRRRLLALESGVTIHPVRGVGYILAETFD